LVLILSALIIYLYKYKIELKKVQYLQGLAEQYKDLVQSTSEGVIRFKGNGEIIGINPAGARLLEFSELMDDCPITEFFDPEDMESLTNALSGNVDSVTAELQLRRESTKPRFINLSLHSRSEESETVYEGIFRDVTEKVLLTEELFKHKNNLEKLVQEKSDQLVTAMKSYEAELKSLSAKLVDSLEEERKRIAQNLHDDMGQALTAIQINLEAMDRIVKGTDSVKMKKRIKENQKLLADVIDQVHETSIDLRPVMLDELGLVPTLNWYFNRFSKRTGLEIQFSHEDLTRKLDTTVSTLLYRITQEAFNNVVKHAEARCIEYDIFNSDDAVVCRIRDDGKGMEPAAAKADVPEKLGLIGIRERVETMEGTFTIDSHSNQGTCLTITIPLGRP